MLFRSRLVVHGGSLRVYARHESREPPAPAVSETLKAERARHLDRRETYDRFAEAVRAYAPRLRQFLADLRRQGHSIAAYGASAKGATLVNYCHVGPDLIDFVADVSAVKRGKVMPGVGVQIVAPTELVARQPDYVLLLAWNFEIGRAHV